ncbi:hypothetical protein ACH5RR_029819 [Cinchona calisaya]|uniref:Semialdehyde dehydrogenase dimerisation domain-containing protein n=1 Tax=Cinchona calisaya TaxID=153742 RepID=A0ABD2YSX3_9GENT
MFLVQDTARDILKNAPGVVVIDDRASSNFPSALEVSNKDAVAVGRICRDVSQDGDYGLDIFVCGDQICKGSERMFLLVRFIPNIYVVDMVVETTRHSISPQRGDKRE